MRPTSQGAAHGRDANGRTVVTVTHDPVAAAHAVG